MIDINSRTVSKLGILLIFTTLAIGQVGAVGWENPSEGNIFKGTITLNASASTSDVTFYYNDGSAKKITTTSVSGGYATTSWDSANAGTGTFDLIVGNGTVNKTISVTADFQNPTLDSNSPTGYISNTGPTIDASFSDQHASIDHTNITVFDSSGNIVKTEFSSSTNPSFSLSSLSNGETYTVEYWANDTVGNELNKSDWTFTVDTSYDGDTTPSFDPDGGVVNLTSNGNVNWGITLDGQENGEAGGVKVGCYDGKGQFDSEGFTTIGSSTTKTFTCNIDGDDYAGSTQDMYVKMFDKAGNSKKSSAVSFTFDAAPPAVTRLETEASVNVFNDNFKINIGVSDDASGVEKVEYFFDDESTSEGKGASVSYSSGMTGFRVDTSGLGSGSHTLYMRAKDKAGRWGSLAKLPFEYYPNATPQVELEIPSGINVTNGESKSFDVVVKNTGELFIEETNVSVSAGDFYSASGTVSDLSGGGSSTLSFSLDSSGASLGYHDVKVSTKSPSASKSFKVLVRASEKQERSINQTYNKYLERLKELKQNTTALKPGLSQSRKERLEANVSEFEMLIQNAEEAIANGRYYEAKSILSGIESEYSAAQESYETVKKEQAAADRKRMYMIIAAVLLLGLGGIGAFFYTSEEYDLNIDALSGSDIAIEGLEDIPLRVKTFFKDKEEEAENFEWNGFDN